jgi:hypothetical protein
VSAPGYISATELYRLSEAKRRLGMGRHSFARLRQVELPIFQVGRNLYVNGADIIEALKLAATQQDAERAAAEQAGEGGQGDG